MTSTRSARRAATCRFQGGPTLGRQRLQDGVDQRLAVARVVGRVEAAEVADFARCRGRRAERRQQGMEDVADLDAFGAQALANRVDDEGAIGEHRFEDGRIPGRLTDGIGPHPRHRAGRREELEAVLDERGGGVDVEPSA